MGWKTAVNTNIYIAEEDADGLIPDDPALQAHRYVSCGLEGTYDTIKSDTKLPGRNPSKNYRGTDSNAGDFAVNFAPNEYEKLLAAVLCSEHGFVKDSELSDDTHDVFKMLPGNKQRSFALLKEFSQDPKLYQLFRGVQVNTLGIQFTIGALVKMTFGLMGSNNPLLEETLPVGMANKLTAFDTDEYITTKGNWKYKGEEEPEPVEYIDGVDISLNISNNMSDLKGLFQPEAIDKSLNMLDITGNINEYVKDGKLYNRAKRGADGTLYITVRSDKHDIEYTLVLNISFDNSTMSGDSQLQYALPFTTYGEDRFYIIKKAPAAPEVVEPEPEPEPEPEIDVEGVTLNKNTLTLVEGETEQLEATVEPDEATNKEVTWSSSDEGVATVDPDGLVEAVAAGNAVITVTTEDKGFEATCSVEVTAV